MKYEKLVHWRNGPLYAYFEYRCESVPGVHKKHRGHFYRRIRTIPEKRAWFATVDQLQEEQLICKLRRSPRVLPDSWDDIKRNDYEDRSWKRTKRKRQWKIERK